MTGFDSPLNWLVVDDRDGDAENIALAVSDLGGRCVVARDLKSAERAIKKTVFDACVVDCFFAGSAKTGEDLVPAIRASNVSIPIIMTSSSQDPDLPRRVIEAGADIFVNKMADYITYRNAIKSAFTQAKAYRANRCRELVSIRSSTLFLCKDLTKQIDSICKRPSENVLILGPSGSGKSAVAALISDGSVKRSMCSSVESIRTIDCGKFKGKDATKVLFGCDKQNDEGMLAGVPGGVIVLENIDSLDKVTQFKLKDYFSKDAIRSDDNINRPRFIFTAKVEQATGAIADGFFETIADREILLPSLYDLNGQGLLTEAIQQAARAEIASIDVGEIRFEESAFTYFSAIVSSRVWSNNFRGLRKAIRAAVESAVDDGRAKVLCTDFDKAVASIPQNRIAGISDDVQELLHDGDCKALLAMIAEGRDYRVAQDLLKRLILRFAAKQQGQNKTKMRKVLGLSRGHLYDCLREMGGAK